MDRWIVDTRPSTRYPIYTRANVGEVFPEPVAPLTATLGIQQLAEPGWRDAWIRFGAFTEDEFDPEQPEMIGVFGGYCFLNVSASRILGVRTPGLSPEIIDQNFFGEQPGIPPYQPGPTDERPDRTAAIAETLQWVLTARSLDELTDEQAALNALRDARPDLTTLSDAELAARGRHLLESRFRHLFGTHIFITYASTVPVGIIQDVCTAVGRPDAIMPLIAGVGDVESAAPSMRMWELGRVATSSSSVSAAFDEGIIGLPDRLRALAADGDGDADRFLTGFAAFQHDFGARGPNEWEVRSPTWETRPELALAAIDRMRVSDESRAPALQQRRRAATRERLGAEILPLVDGDPTAQAQFRAALHASTLFLAGRERSKTNAIKLVHECRVTMEELGRRMVEAGHFERPGTYGMLLADEIDQFAADPGSLAAELREREAAYATLSTVEPPFVFEGAPPPLGEWVARGGRDVPVLGIGASMSGLPGCSGRAVGRARVLLDSLDPGALEPGDVLVAPLTDPSWTPLFVPAAAVVVDVGAALSHAIIVSRELGIPCVVSATDATRRIPDGSLVEVDGDTGTVTLLEPA